MKLLKRLGIVFGVYVVFVIVFEFGFLGLLQPKLDRTGLPMLVLTTTDESGDFDSRRLARFETDWKIYVSAHHWPRGWYHRAIEHTNVRAEVDGLESDYVAVPVDGEEFDRVATQHPLPFRFKFVMGFPPERDILRLDPAK